MILLLCFRSIVFTISGKINFPINRQGQAQKTYATDGHDVKKSLVDGTKIVFDGMKQQAEDCGNVADIGCASVQTDVEQEQRSVENIESAEKSFNVQTVTRLSPRLEMRLALNHDIMDDEDLISFDPGPINLAAILGRDLLSYHRFTGRDLISRSASRVVPKEALISFSQQKNSKMDTPTPNRKAINQNTWNNSGYVDESKCHRIKVFETNK